MTKGALLAAFILLNIASVSRAAGPGPGFAIDREKKQCTQMKAPAVDFAAQLIREGFDVIPLSLIAPRHLGMYLMIDFATNKRLEFGVARERCEIGLLFLSEIDEAVKAKILKDQVKTPEDYFKRYGNDGRKPASFW